LALGATFLTGHPNPDGEALLAAVDVLRDLNKRCSAPSVKPLLTDAPM
jgi:hypothetical protein